MATEIHGENLFKLAGNSGSKVSVVRWTPSASATQTLTEARGVLSVTRSGAGAYTINLTERRRCVLFAQASGIENDTTNYHQTRVESTAAGMSVANSVTVSHKSVAVASVASGMAANDTIDEICVLIVQGD